MFSIILQPTLKRASEISRRVLVDLHAKAFGDANKHHSQYCLRPRNLPARVGTAKSECSESIVEIKQTAPAQWDDCSDYPWLVLISEDKVNKGKTFVVT
jgi:hypothetical protein